MPLIPKIIEWLTKKRRFDEAIELTEKLSTLNDRDKCKALS